jgi:hypothetical protein
LVALILATLIDLACATLLIWTSGFIFGGGPEGANGEPTAVAVWIAGLTSCFVAIAAGFILRAWGKPGYGALVAFIPPVIGAFFFAV